MDKKRQITSPATEDGDKCRSLVCDPSGIIIAEMVYRCMICHYVSEAIQESREHYQSVHMQDENDEEDGHHESRSTESMLYKDKAQVNRSLQQHKQMLQQQRRSMNPMIPDLNLSMYEDDRLTPRSFKSEGNASILTSMC